MIEGIFMHPLAPDHSCNPTSRCLRIKDIGVIELLEPEYVQHTVIAPPFRIPVDTARLILNFGLG